MAATMTLVGTPVRRPNSLRYQFLVTINGADAVIDLDRQQSEMVADAQSGPLRHALNRPNNSSAWIAVQTGQAVALTGGGTTEYGAVSVYAYSAEGNNANLAVAVQFMSDAETGDRFMRVAARRVTGTSAPDVSASIYVELRYNHTTDR